MVLLYGSAPDEPITPQCPSEYVEWLKTTVKKGYALARLPLRKNAERQKILYNKNTCLRAFKPGD